MAVKFSSFDAMTKQNKITTLSQIKIRPQRTQDDLHLALHALLDEDQQIRLTAKLVYQLFSQEPFFLDLRGLAFDQVKEKVTAFLRKTYGYRPQRIEIKSEISIPELSKDLQNRLKTAERHGEWDGPFPRTAALLNTLRDDSRRLISAQLEEEEKMERAYLGFYQESLKPFRDGVRSLDSTTVVNIVNLGFVREDLLPSPTFQTLFTHVDNPCYLLLILTTNRLLLFLRDEIKSSAAALQAIPYNQIVSAEAQATPRGTILTLETRQDIIAIPRMFPADAQEIEGILKEKSISAIQADEGFIERDFERELSRLELLYQGKAVSNAEYVFRKNRLKKMELEKFSDTNIEAMLAKRFADAGFGQKVDQELLKRFSSEKTIMFTDIVGYSKKAAEKRLLDTVTLLAVHDRTLLPIVRQNSGHLVKKIGDALMVRFDEPNQACQAALEMQKALVEFNRSSPEKILVRIGINTGTVFIRNEDTFGEAVNVASRMESLAKPGRIFLTETTANKLSGAFQTEDCGLKSIKGYAQPIRVFSLVDGSGQFQEMLVWAGELETESRDALGGAPDSETASLNASPIPSRAAPKSQKASVSPATPQAALQAADVAIMQAVELYKTAIRLGHPRSAQIEDWFNFFANHIRKDISETPPPTEKPA
jgi:class 3 adenylate cyclase